MTNAHTDPAPLTASKSTAITGTITVPGDKSISHRSIMFGAITIGETMVSGLLEGEDVLATAAAMRAMGASIEKGDDGLWRIHGTGLGGLHEPNETLDMGNSGTSTRLLMGLIGAHNITATMNGDASLSKRPMNRVIKPLEQMGIRFEASEGGRLPLKIIGAQDAMAFQYRLPVASAQVKSAILLAGLNATGRTTVIEEKPTRDHTENMLRHFGVDVEIENLEDGAQAISVIGGQHLQPCAIDVPADPSSAAFPTVAALLSEGSNLTITNIGTNERRFGLFETLIDMGADIEIKNKRTQGGEPVADIIVRASALKGITVPESRVPSMIDEFPILAVAASCAEGTTIMTGLEELRVKESDRLALMAKGLKACGVSLEEGEDSLTIHGTGRPPHGLKEGDAAIATELDHRIAMAFLVLGGVSANPITIDDSAPIKTSFPNFVELMEEIGCNYA